MIKNYLMGYFAEKTNIKSIKNDDELKNILFKYHRLSAIKIEYILNKFKFTIYLSQTMPNLERAKTFFNYVEKIINELNIPLNEPKYILFTHANAIHYQTRFPIISSSRAVDNNKIVLWSQLFNKEINNYLDEYLSLKDNDLKWEKKISKFFFRGINSGTPFPSLKSYCLGRSSRFELVKRSCELGSSYTEIGFTILHNPDNLLSNYKDLDYLTRKYGNRLCTNKNVNDLQEEIKFAIKNTKGFTKMIDIFKYKFIICPEGHDCSSMLNWVLASNSMAIVPPFHFDNVIINSKMLQPYIHFVPIKEDFSDLESVINWCLENDSKCQEIVKNANNYMKDLIDKKFMYSVQKDIIKDLITN